MLPVGFKQTDTMRGTMRFVKDPERERVFEFTCDYVMNDWAKFVADGTTQLSGTVRCEGLARNAAMTGTLRIDPLRSRRLVYEFTFPAAGRKRLRFLGEKRVDLFDPVASMTTLYGQLFDRDAVIATGVLRFDVKELPAFLLSLRPVKIG